MFPLSTFICHCFFNLISTQCVLTILEGISTTFSDIFTEKRWQNVSGPEIHLIEGISRYFFTGFFSVFTRSNYFDINVENGHLNVQYRPYK